MTEAEQMGRYNGWANYETWAVNLWLTNKQGRHEYWRLLARVAWKCVRARDFLSRKEVAASHLSAQLQGTVMQNKLCVLRPGPGLYIDLLDAALSKVDWYEIAWVLLEEFAEKEEAEQGDE